MYDYFFKIFGGGEVKKNFQDLKGSKKFFRFKTLFFAPISATFRFRKFFLTPLLISKNFPNYFSLIFQIWGPPLQGAYYRGEVFPQTVQFFSLVPSTARHFVVYITVTAMFSTQSNKDHPFSIRSIIQAFKNAMKDG